MPKPAYQRSNSLLAALLEGAMARIVYNKELKLISDQSLTEALSAMATRLRQIDAHEPSIQKDTPEIIIAEAVSTGLRIGTDWWTGMDTGSHYATITNENMLRPRVLADVVPEFVTRMYLCQVAGPATVKPKKVLVP